MFWCVLYALRLTVRNSDVNAKLRHISANRIPRETDSSRRSELCYFSAIVALTTLDCRGGDWWIFIGIEEFCECQIDLFSRVRNPGVHTVELVLEKALVEKGAISPENAGSFNKVCSSDASVLLFLTVVDWVEFSSAYWQRRFSIGQCCRI